MFAFKLVCEVCIKMLNKKKKFVGWINLGIERLWIIKVVPGYIFCVLDFFLNIFF